MSFLDRIRFGKKADGAAAPKSEAVTLPSGLPFNGLDDPRFLEFIRAGVTTGSRSLRNMAILRCVSLISNSIGMLPTNLLYSGPEKLYATEHPGYRLLKRRPNDWQTPMELKSLLQLHALTEGNGYARIIRVGDRPIRMIPMDPKSTKPRQTSDWTVVYDYTTPAGDQITLQSKDVFHLRNLSVDGIEGLSPIKLADEVIELARDAQRAASRVFSTGVLAGGALQFEKALSDTAYKRMKESLREDYSGTENAGKWMLVEEGGKATQFDSTASDAQHIENRNHQIEEVARLYGVPRPLLMMDDTSWGSGIEQLGIAFVQYTLAPWFVAWEQALSRSLLTESEMEGMQWKFNERALLRGTLKDQADFFAKALGAGGQAPFMTQNEVRELSDMPRSDDANADKLRNPMTQKAPTNEPASTT